MSSPSNPAHEPTMEEILASIRKIISEDQPEAATPEAPKAPEPAPAVTPAPAPAVHARAHADDDVLDLTDEVHEDHSHDAGAAHGDPADDIAFATIDDPAEPKEEAPAMDHDDLISESTRGAVGRALNPLDERPAARGVSMPSSGSLDALFVHAVQEAIHPVLQEWVQGNSAEIVAQLKPIIREWMDHNLPDLIENTVKREISRRAR